MSKSLKDILNGVNKSTKRPGSTGSNNAIDYAPKSSGDKAFVAKHETEEHDDREGNTGEPYKSSAKEAKYKKQNPKVYESSDNGSDTCNHKYKGNSCPICNKKIKLLIDKGLKK